MAQAVQKSLNEEGGASFLKNSQKSTTFNQLKLDILVDVIETKESENEVRKNRTEAAAKAAQIRELINAKQNEALGAQSVEDLMKQLQALEALV
jgi:hypothetical protein